MASWGPDHDPACSGCPSPTAEIPILLPQKCVLKGPKMLHWLPTLSVLVATRPGLRVALGTATILLIFAMAIASLVREKGPSAPPPGHAGPATGSRGDPWIWEDSWPKARGC